MDFAYKRDREKGQKQSKKLILIKIKKNSILCETGASYTVRSIF